MTALNVILILIAAKIGIKNIRKYITRPHKLKMELIKYSNIDRVKVIDLPDELYEVDEKAIQSNELAMKTEEYFGKKLVQVVKREDLDNYYRNFATIKEKDLSKKFLLSNLLQGKIVGGGYDIKENTIDLETTAISKLMHSIIHELLHAASRYYDEENNVIYCGFSQYYLNKDDPRKSEIYGMGINEGCTQYFANKYFLNVDNFLISRKIYPEEQEIIQTIEMVVGEEKLKSLYFRADLNGLVNILEKYASREDIYKFINYTDVLCFYTRDKNLKFQKLNEVKEFINMFLLKIYNNAIAAGDITREGNIRLPYKIK